MENEKLKELNDKKVEAFNLIRQISGINGQLNNLNAQYNKLNQEIMKSEQEYIAQKDNK